MGFLPMANKEEVSSNTQWELCEAETKINRYMYAYFEVHR